MTEQEYTEALRKTHIPSGPDWNQRYLDALEAVGLRLVLLPDEDWGYYCQAPLPVPNQSPSWGESLIVPKE